MALTLPPYLSLVASDASYQHVIHREFFDPGNLREREALKRTCQALFAVADIQDGKIIEHANDIELLFKRRLDWEHFLAAEDMEDGEPIIVEVFSQKADVKPSRQAHKIGQAYWKAAKAAGVGRLIEIDVMRDTQSTIIEAANKLAYFGAWQLMPANRKATLEMVRTPA